MPPSVEEQRIELSMSFFPSGDEAELKDLCRQKEELSGKLGDEVRRICSHMHRNCQELHAEFQDLSIRNAREHLSARYGHDYTLMRCLDTHASPLDESKREAAKIEQRGANDRNVEMLENIPGIGRQTAVTLMSLIVHVDRFKDPEKLCAYFGMVPRVRDSGERNIMGGDQERRSHDALDHEARGSLAHPLLRFVCDLVI
jgi:transposase